MKIRLRFIVVPVPAGLRVESDGCSVIDLAEGTTLDQVVASLTLPSDATYLTLLNEESVPIAERPQRRLAEGDLLTVFSPLKGG